MQTRRLAARIGAYDIDLVCWHVQLVVAAILQKQIVAFGPANRARNHAGESCNSVLAMNDVITGLEVVDSMARASDASVIACTMGFSDPGIDERPHARAAAAQFVSFHTIQGLLPPSSRVTGVR